MLSTTSVGEPQKRVNNSAGDSGKEDCLGIDGEMEEYAI
jgi:hypothetical protein